MSDRGWEEIFPVDGPPVDGELAPFDEAASLTADIAADIEAAADELHELSRGGGAGFSGRASDAFSTRVADYVSDIRRVIEPLRDAERAFGDHRDELDDLRQADQRALALANERDDAKTAAEESFERAAAALRTATNSVDAATRAAIPDETHIATLEADRWQRSAAVQGAGQRARAAAEELELSRRAYDRLLDEEDDLDRSTASTIGQLALPAPLDDFFSHESVDLEAPAQLWVSINATITASGLEPLKLHEHARLSDDQLIDFYQTVGYELAGIENWDPRAGLGEQDANIQAAYDYYGQLYLSDPENFYWMGLGNIVGPPLYAGFVDLYVIRSGLQDGSISVDEVAEFLTSGIPGGPLVDDMAGTLARVGEATLAQELFWIEGTFLSMQKEIFDDMVWQHIAYNEGGIELMERLIPQYEPDDLRQQTLLLDSWRAIDEGDPATAATLMVDREQNHTIQDDYDDIWNHSIVGSSLVTAMSFIAPNPVEGGASFFESVILPRTEINPAIPLPDLPWIDIPFAPDEIPIAPDFSVPTGLDPTANIANQADRWQWIEDDISPTYLELVENDPAAVADLVAISQADRMDSWRTLPNIGPFAHEPS